MAWRAADASFRGKRAYSGVFGEDLALFRDANRLLSVGFGCLLRVRLSGREKVGHLAQGVRCSVRWGRPERAYRFWGGDAGEVKPRSGQAGGCRSSR